MMSRQNAGKFSLLLSLLAVLVLVLAACGAPAPAGDSGGDGGGDAASEEAAPEPEAADSEEEAEGDDAAEGDGEEEALGSTLIGEIEGPTIITDEGAFPSELNEAPMLAEMVEAGDLPPVEERLPAVENLLVIDPVHEIGEYGGTWRRGFLGPADGQNGHRVAGGDRFVFWDAENFPEVVPNLAKSWEVNDGGQEIIINLREGVKWSDGEPFTSADVMFWFDNMYNNEELVAVQSPFFNVGEGATLEAPDEYTLRFTFPFENSLFLEVLGASVNVFGGHAIFGATALGGYAPAHYMSQFHADVVDADELDALVEEAGFDNWVNLFKDKNTWQRNPDLPVLTPWMTENPITTDNWVLVRNPYYYGVDSAGNQLPYIDRISMTLAEEPQVLNLRAIAGEYDYQARHVALSNLPVLLENAEAEGYSVALDPAQHGADGVIQINQSYRGDDEIAKWLMNADFRRALSMGIDRDSINEILFLGIGTPGSAVVAESSPFNPGPEYRDLWSTLDVDAANEMLDSIGLTEKDDEGYRLRTDNGERLIIEMNPVPAFIEYTKLAELVKTDWADIGIFVNVLEQERGLVMTRRDANELQVFLWQNDGTDELFLFPYHALPVTTLSGTGIGYGTWYASGGESGVEPTDESVLKIIDLFDQGLKATAEERIEIGISVRSVSLVPSWVFVSIRTTWATSLAVSSTFRRVRRRMFLDRLPSSSRTSNF